MEFRIDDSDYDPQNHIPVGVEKIMRVCEKLEPGQLITTQRLTELMNMSHGGLMKNTRHPALEPYRAKYHGGRYNLFGNRDTIAEYERITNT